MMNGLAALLSHGRDLLKPPQSKGNQNMAFFSLEHASDPRHLSLVSSLAGLRARAVASWQRHRAERVLESLSYDTLKDIGFPSVDMARKDTQAK